MKVKGDNVKVKVKTQRLHSIHYTQWLIVYALCIMHTAYPRQLTADATLQTRGQR